MNQKSFLHKYVISKEGHSWVKGELSPIFGHINIAFLWVTGNVLFCWRSNCEDCTGKMIEPFIWIDLNEIANLINKRGINCNYDSILAIDLFMTSTNPTHGNQAKIFSKWQKRWRWRSLMFILVETFYESVIVMHSFRRLESIPTWFGWENTICHILQL